MTRRKILEVTPRKIKDEDIKPKKQRAKRKGKKKEIQQISGEKDYKWCEGVELPVVTVIFEKGKIIEERTNDEIVRISE